MKPRLNIRNALSKVAGIDTGVMQPLAHMRIIPDCAEFAICIATYLGSVYIACAQVWGGRTS
jgi:hypothetical protein